MLKLCTVCIALALAGCTSGLYTSRATLDAQRTQKAISYDGVVEYIETETPTVVLKVLEYRSRGSESPQVSLTFTFLCTINTEPKGEDCYPINGNDGNPLTYAATGTGLLNDTLAGIGSAAVTGGSIAGAARLLRPPSYQHTESTSIDGVSRSDAGADAHTSSTLVNVNNDNDSIRADADAHGGSAAVHQAPRHVAPRPKHHKPSRSTQR